MILDTVVVDCSPRNAEIKPYLRTRYKVPVYLYLSVGTLSQTFTYKYTAPSIDAKDDSNFAPRVLYATLK